MTGAWISWRHQGFCLGLIEHSEPLCIFMWLACQGGTIWVPDDGPAGNHFVCPLLQDMGDTIPGINNEKLAESTWIALAMCGPWKHDCMQACLRFMSSYSGCDVFL